METYKRIVNSIGDTIGELAKLAIHGFMFFAIPVSIFTASVLVISWLLNYFGLV